MHIGFLPVTALGLGLILVAVARAWGAIDGSNVLSYALVGGLAALLIALLVLSAHMKALTPPDKRIGRHSTLSARINC